MLFYDTSYDINLNLIYINYLFQTYFTTMKSLWICEWSFYEFWFRNPSEVQLSRLVSTHESKRRLQGGRKRGGSFLRCVCLRLIESRSWVGRQTMNSPSRYLGSYVFDKDFSKGLARTDCRLNCTTGESYFRVNITWNWYKLSHILSYLFTPK